MHKKFAVNEADNFKKSMICFVAEEWRKMSGRKRLYLKNAKLIYMCTVTGAQNR